MDPINKCGSAIVQAYDWSVDTNVNLSLVEAAELYNSGTGVYHVKKRCCFKKFDAEMYSVIIQTILNNIVEIIETRFHIL